MGGIRTAPGRREGKEGIIGGVGGGGNGGGGRCILLIAATTGNGLDERDGDELPLDEFVGNEGS